MRNAGGVGAMKILLLTVLSVTTSYLYFTAPESSILLADLGVPMDVGSILVATPTEGC